MSWVGWYVLIVVGGYALPWLIEGVWRYGVFSHRTPPTGTAVPAPVPDGPAPAVVPAPRARHRLEDARTGAFLLADVVAARNRAGDEAQARMAAAIAEETGR